MRSGWSSGSIFRVLLVSGWISLSKTIIPDAQEHFLTPSARRDTHLFGGLGLTYKLEISATIWVISFGVNPDVRFVIVVLIS